MKKALNLFYLLVCLVLLVSCKHTVNKYNVKFDANGGTGSVPLVSVNEGELVTLPIETNNFFNEDLIIKSWSISEDGKTTWKFNTDRIYSDITLYAIWGASEIDLNGYMESTKEWTTSGNLYIHYKRTIDTTEEYSKWNLWIWAFAPKRYEGIAIEWSRYDETGAIGELDMSKAYTDAGTAGNLYADFFEVNAIGFLVVFKESKQLQEGMWTSDGGNTYVYDIQSYLDSFGSVHIFCTQLAVAEFSVNTPNNFVQTDPYENLEPGEGESKHLIDSSLDNAVLRTQTSNEFYGVGYQIQVSSFADSDADGFGDINGITNNLDYLSDLGVKVLWLTPVQLANNYHGYDIIDYYKIDPRFGTMEDYQNLLNKAHEKGLKIFMDFVINHTANNAIWFKNSALFKTEKATYDLNRDGAIDDMDIINYRDFYTWRYQDNIASDKVTDDGVYIGGGSGNGSAIWFQYSTYGYYYFGSFSSAMPELNFDYQGTRDAIIDVGKYYLEMGVDGFRLDAVKHIYTAQEARATNKPTDQYSGDGIYEANVTKNLNFFNEFTSRLKEFKSDCFIVGENFDGNNDNIAPYVKSLDSQFSFPALYSLSSQIDASNPTGSYYQDGYYQFKDNRTALNSQEIFIDSPFTSNHDVVRAINFVSGEPTEGVPNGGRNIKSIKREYYESRAKLWSSIIMTLPGLSWIFYGDELGMASNLYPNEYGNPNSYLDRWYRQPMKWEYGKNSQTTSFYVEAWLIEWQEYNKTLLGVKEQMLLRDSMLNHYKDVINLKNSIKEIREGDIYFWNDSQNGIMVYERRLSDNERVLVYHNMLNQAVTDYQFAGSNYRPNLIYAQNGSSANIIGPYSTVIVRLN